MKVKLTEEEEEEEGLCLYLQLLGNGFHNVSTEKADFRVMCFWHSL